MFRDREEIRRRLFEVIEKFRAKGAINPEKALTLQELGLPPRFEQAMHRRLGQTGIFVEVNGKYYLNEERLRQIKEQREQAGVSGGGRGWQGGGSLRRTMMTLRFARLATMLILVATLGVNVFVQSLELRLASLLFMAVWLVLFAVFAYYRSKVMRRFSTFVQTF